MRRCRSAVEVLGSGLYILVYTILVTDSESTSCSSWLMAEALQLKLKMSAPRIGIVGCLCGSPSELNPTTKLVFCGLALVHGCFGKMF